ARVESVPCLRRRLPAVVRGCRRDLRARAATQPPARGRAAAGEAPARDRGLARLQPRHRPRRLAAVRLSAGPRRSCERAGRAGDAASPRARVRDGRARRALAVVRRVARRPRRLGRRVHRALRARNRRPAVRTDQHGTRTRDARRGRPRGCLCLAAMADELKAAYLLAGTDRPKIDRALERLRRRFEPDTVELLSAADVSGDDVVAACNALGLFAAAGRLVVVDGVEAWKAADAKAVAAYLKAPAPATTVALLAGELKKDAPLARAVAGVGDVLIWDVPKRG